MLVELKNLATEKSSEKRLDLLRRITNLYFEGADQHTEAEIYLFNEVIENIVDKISREARIDVATNLAVLPGFPIPVVRRLAYDPDIEIAGPVLRGSADLTDTDLVELARQASDQHLNVMAGRDQLSEIVTDVLIDRGSRVVAHSVSANPGARLSEHGMDALIRKAQDDGHLQELLADRQDLSQAAVEQLLPLITEAVAMKLAQRGYQLPVAASSALARNTGTEFAEAMRRRHLNAEHASHVIAQFLAKEITLDAAVNDVVKRGQLLDVASLLSHPSGLDRNFLFGLLVRGTLPMMMVVFRALEVDWPAFSAVLTLRAKRQRSGETVGAKAEHDYNAIEVAVARRTLEFLRLRGRMAGSVAGKSGREAPAVA